MRGLRCRQDPQNQRGFSELGSYTTVVPMACATSSTSASVASHKADKALMEEIRWAKKKSVSC
jgi:hypothetical protein